MGILEEYVRHYDPEDGSSTVRDKIIGIDEVALQNVLYLPIAEMSVGGEVPSDFQPTKYFKPAERAFEKNQGWKVSNALTPELSKWMRFMQKQLGLNRHTTYISKRLLFVVIGTLEGMQFNWVAYVATRIHAELELKMKQGKCIFLLCFNYVDAVIRIILNQSMASKELGKSPALPVPIGSEESELVVVPIAVRVSTLSGVSGEGLINQEFQTPRRKSSRLEIGNCSTNSEQVTPISLALLSPVRREEQGRGFKERLLAQISQLQVTINQWKGNTNLRQELERTKIELEKRNKYIIELNRVYPMRWNCNKIPSNTSKH